MCLMVCIDAVFLSSSQLPREKTFRYSRNLSKVEGAHYNTVLQTWSTRIRKERAVTQNEKLHYPNVDLLESRKFDCDYFSAPILSLTRSQKPCFLGTVPTRITVEEGATILLQCIVYNVNFSTVVISWWREGLFRELTLGLETYNSRFRLPRVSYQDWSLQINSVRLNDSGIYVCQINLEQIFEKFFRVEVKEKRQLSEPPKYSEQEFVKDDAFPREAVPQMRIEGQNEGFIGATLSLSCIAQISPRSTNITALIWSHGNGPQRYFLSFHANGHTDVENLLRSYIETDRSGKRVQELRSAENENLRITTNHYENRTIRSELIFTKLSFEQAGVWRCSQFFYPNGPIIEEAKMMVYVRAKKSSFKEQASYTTMQYRKNTAPSLFCICNRHIDTLFAIILNHIWSRLIPSYS